MVSKKHNGNVMELLRFIAETNVPRHHFHVEGRLLWFETGYSPRVECSPGDVLQFDGKEFSVVTASELEHVTVDPENDLPF